MSFDVIPGFWELLWGGMAASDEYRKYAAECMALAQKAAKPQDRARLVEMAQHWLELAAKAERGGGAAN